MGQYAMAVIPGKIQVLAELENIGRSYEFSGTENVKVLCPFHEDKHPTCSVSTESGEFNCFACGKHGDFLAFLSQVLDKPRQFIQIYLQQRYDIGDEASVDPDLVERYHSRIWEAGPLLAALRARGISDETIRTRRLGENAGRITIPIANKAGRYVNIKSYLPGAVGTAKMKNLKGRGKPRLYPVDQLRFDRIAVCGGEIKGLAAAEVLNPHGIGALSTTVGESNWDVSFTEALSGKEQVWIIDDIDAAGIAGANMKARNLYSAVQWVGVVVLPLDPEKWPKGGVDDFICQEKGDLPALLEATPQWSPSIHRKLDDSEAPTKVSLFDAYGAEYTEKKISVHGVVAALAEETYVIPAKVSVECDRNQEFCGLCRVYAENKDIYDIHPEDPANLGMLDASRFALRDACMQALGVPRQCPSFEHKVVEHRQADEIRVSPQLEMLSRSVDRTMQRMICMRKGLQLNENYSFIGRQYPHPRDQSATVLVSDYEATGDALTSFDLQEPGRLEKFRPKEWTVDSLRDKLDAIYADLEYNVTYIRQRRPLHALMDLVWHSSLFMTLDDRVEKAYVEALVVGDSAQGKSETAKRLLDHYGTGTKVECKNATVAGLLGGLQQINGRWFVAWGLIPTHDKRLVILEELKGAPVELISKLTDMRSSGIAEIPKIEKRRAMARTRLLALSNPRSERQMSAYAFGLEAVQELIGAPEDVRRFDTCMILSKEDVSEEIINQPRDSWPKVAHEYDSTSCKDLILWAWTRSEKQVRFEREAELLVLKCASAMCKTFTSNVPIVDIASMRLKLARLAVAIANRTFSTSDDYETLVVRSCHVEWVNSYLTDMYSSPTFGYLDYTKAVMANSHMADADVIRKTIRNVMHAKEFCENLLNTTKFDHQDLQDWAGTDRVEAAALMSLLHRKRAVSRDRHYYVKNPGLIVLLKELLSSGELAGLPDHLREGEF